MEIKTKFNLSDKVWTINEVKAVEIEIAAMVVDDKGVWVRDKSDFTLYHENNCFTTKEKLIKHIMNGN